MKLFLLLALGATLAVVSPLKEPNPFEKISLQDATMLHAWSFLLPRLYRETRANPRTETLKLFDAYRHVHSKRVEFRVHYSIVNKATQKVSRPLGWCQSILQEAVPHQEPFPGVVNYTLHSFTIPPNKPVYVFYSP